MLSFNNFFFLKIVVLRNLEDLSLLFFLPSFLFSCLGSLHFFPKLDFYTICPTLILDRH